MEAKIQSVKNSARNGYREVAFEMTVVIPHESPYRLTLVESK